MPEGDAELLEFLVPEIEQRLLVNVILDKEVRVPIEANTPEPLMQISHLPKRNDAAPQSSAVPRPIPCSVIILSLFPIHFNASP